MYRCYKVRLYPTKEQEELMWKHVNACRYIWNWMLEYCKTEYIQGRKTPKEYEMIKLLSPLINDGNHDWLKEPSVSCYQTICRDLRKAYERFFNGISRYPKFKSKKHAKNIFPIRCNRMYFKDDNFLFVEKIGKIKYKTDFKFLYGRNRHKFTDSRIRNINGKWLVIFGMECENQAYKYSLKNVSMGIDLGIKELAVVEYNGNKIVFHNINKSKRIKYFKKQIKHTHRSMMRKFIKNKKGNIYIKTNNIMKDIYKLRKLYARMYNIRVDYINKTTHYLVSLLPKRVVMETLSIKGMMKNRCLSRAISEQYWGEFIRQMKYKCEQRGIEFITADKFFPSSKKCSCCGSVKKILHLRERVYKCEKCGIVIDRDYNAAINLSRYIV